MLKEETAKILSILKVNYPQSFKSWTYEQSNVYLDLWTEAFKDTDFKLVACAVKSIIYTDTNEFAPNIAKVKKEIFNLIYDEPDEYEIFAKITDTLERAKFDDRATFEELPLIAKEIIKSPSQLKEWAWSDTSTLNGVIASNFYKAFRKKRDEKFKTLALPTEFKKQLSNVKGELKLENKI